MRLAVVLLMDADLTTTVLRGEHAPVGRDEWAPVRVAKVRTATVCPAGGLHDPLQRGLRRTRCFEVWIADEGIRDAPDVLALSHAAASVDREESTGGP